MTDCCDPVLAPLRCWEHEDCLEHPDLGLACAGGRATVVLMSADARYMVATSGYPARGDGYACSAHDNERGEWYGHYTAWLGDGSGDGDADRLYAQGLAVLWAEGGGDGMFPDPERCAGWNWGWGDPFMTQDEAYGERCSLCARDHQVFTRRARVGGDGWPAGDG